jgi:uncharacterized membrane protein
VGEFFRVAGDGRRNLCCSRRRFRPDRFSRQSIRAQKPAWPHAIGNVVLLILATLNMFVHSRDAWTSVVPWGLTLSALCVLILMFTAWMGRSMVYGHRVGVAE